MQGLFAAIAISQGIKQLSRYVNNQRDPNEKVVCSCRVLSRIKNTNIWRVVQLDMTNMFAYIYVLRKDSTHSKEYMEKIPLWTIHNFIEADNKDLKSYMHQLRFKFIDRNGQHQQCSFGFQANNQRKDWISAMKYYNEEIKLKQMEIREVRIKREQQNKIILEGQLLKRSKFMGKWNIRYVTLSGSLLKTHQYASQRSYNSNATQTIKVETIFKLEKLPKLNIEGFCFPFRFQGWDKLANKREFQFRCQTYALRRAWIDQIYKVVLKSRGIVEQESKQKLQGENNQHEKIQEEGNKQQIEKNDYEEESKQKLQDENNKHEKIQEEDNKQQIENNDQKQRDKKIFGGKLLKKSKHLKKWNIRLVKMTEQSIVTHEFLSQNRYNGNSTESISFKSIRSITQLPNEEQGQQYRFPFVWCNDKHGKLRVFEFRCQSEEDRKNWINNITKMLSQTSA